MEKSVMKGDMVLYIPDPNDEEAIVNGISGGLPAVVVSVWGDAVNLRVFTDGEDVLWKTSVLRIYDDDIHLLHDGKASIDFYRGGGWIFRS